MKLAMSTANWRTATAAVVACVVLLIIIAVLSVGPADDTLAKRPSTFFTDQSGARGIYLVLQETLHSAELWRRPFTDLNGTSGSRLTTLIVMGPSSPLGLAEDATLNSWITSGGQLIFASGGGWRMGKRTGEPFAKEFLESHGLFPHGGLKGAQALEHVQMASVGRGRIVYVPDAYAFSDETLRTTDNAVWLADRISEWGSTVGFDEYHHGFGEQRGLTPVIASFALTPWGLACLQVGLAGVVYILGFKRRFGSVIEELPVERTNPMEAVHAVGGFFEAARANVLSVRTIHQYLNAHLSAIVGYPVDILKPEVRERIALRGSIDPIQLDRYAKAVQGALQSQRVSDEAFVQIGKDATAIARGNYYYHPLPPP
jgi:hypothetical protein